LKVFITDRAYKQIRKEVNRQPYRETGGIMVGFSTPNSLIITDATGPGPSAVHQPYSIRFDERYCAQKVKQLKRRGKHQRYVGDWHSHPFSKLKPSKVDRRSFSMKSVTHYNTSYPLMLIAGPGPAISLKAYLLKKSVSKAKFRIIGQSRMKQLQQEATRV
jgi:integrative and conjugative element protein (TIGR02256 family)